METTEPLLMISPAGKKKLATFLLAFFVTLAILALVACIVASLILSMVICPAFLLLTAVLVAGGFATAAVFID